LDELGDKEAYLGGRGVEGCVLDWERSVDVAWRRGEGSGVLGVAELGDGEVVVDVEPEWANFFYFRYDWN
jgi:hypothetical protein